MSSIGNNLATQITAYNIITEDPALISHETNQRQLAGLARELIEQVEINSDELTAKEAGDALILIGKLQSQGINDPQLNSTKAFLSTIVLSANEAAVKSGKQDKTHSLQQGVAPTGQVPVKDDVQQEGNLPGAISSYLMISDIEQDASLASSFAASMLTGLVKTAPDMKGTFLANLRAFALESVKDTSAQAQLSNTSITNDEILQDMGTGLKNLLAAMSTEDLQSILANITQPEMHNLGLSLNDLIEKYDVRNPKDIEIGMSLNYVYSAFASLHDELKKELLKRDIDPQNRLDLDNFTQDASFIGVNRPFVDMVLVDIRTEINKKFQDDIRDLFGGIATAKNFGEMQKLLENFHTSNFKANMADPKEYLTEVRSFIRTTFNDVVTKLNDKQLEQFLNKLTAPAIAGQLVDIDKSFPDMVTVNKDELQLLISALKQEKAGRVMEKMNFSAPVLSRWEQFKENVSNWFNSLFKQGAVVRNDNILHEAEKFAAANGRMLWQLTDCGITAEELTNMVRERLQASQNGISTQDLERVAVRIGEIFVTGGRNWLQNGFGSTQDLPADDLRVQVRTKSISELGQIYGLDLSGLDSEECLALRETLLKELQFQAINSPSGTITNAIAHDIAGEILTSASKVITAGKKSLLLPEPAKLSSAPEQINFLLSQLSRGISKPGLFVDIAASLAQNFAAMNQADFKARFAADPNARPLDQDGQRLARNREFSKYLNGLPDDQLIHLAEMLESKDFRYLKEGLVLVNQDYDSSSSIGILHYYRVKDTNNTLTSMATAIFEECEKRHLPEPEHDSSTPDTMQDIPAKLQLAIYSFDDTIKININRNIAKQLDTMVDLVNGDKIGQFVDTNHGGDFFEFIVNFYQATGQEPDHDGNTTDFDRFFLPRLTAKLSDLNDTDLLKFYNGLNGQAIRDLETALDKPELSEDKAVNQAKVILKHLKEAAAAQITGRNLPLPTA